MQEKIIILDFGSQTTQLIGRRLRELNVYCEIVPYNKFPYGDESVKGVILSGSPFSVYDKSAFKVDLSGIRGKYPILGICYGAQFISYSNGGRVEPAGTREYGRAHLGSFDSENVLFKGVRKNTQVWMSHGDTITAIPDNFKIIASTDKVAIAAYQVSGEEIWGVQFHPEVFHSEDGTQMLRNFVVDVCGCSQSWSAASFVDTTVAELKEQLGNDRVILGLSGGVDSSVAAVLLHRAIGKNLTCIFVDHGLLRKNEFKNVMKDYECLGLNVIGVDASEKFFTELAGVAEPEAKRKIIGKGFIDVFDVVLVLADGFHRTSFFTRHRNVDDGVIRTALVADTTADTLVVVNLCLTSLLVKVYSSFRTVHVAASCHTTPAKVTYFVVHLYTRRTCFVDDTENIFLDSFLAFQCFAGIFRKRSQLIRFIGHIPAQQRKQLIFSNGTFLVDTAASYRL